MVVTNAAKRPDKTSFLLRLLSFTKRIANSGAPDKVQIAFHGTKDSAAELAAASDLIAIFLEGDLYQLGAGARPQLLK